LCVIQKFWVDINLFFFELDAVGMDVILANEYVLTAQDKNVQRVRGTFEHEMDSGFDFLEQITAAM